jgi:hypothetical protein
MKTNKLFLSIGLLILGLSGCLKNEDFSVNQNNAKLKRIMLYFSLDSETPTSIVKEYEYDENGRVSKTTSPMYQDGIIVGTISYDLYNYNDLNQIIKVENFNANLNSSTGFINLINYTYTYSHDGRKTKETLEYPYGGYNDYYLYEYKNGKLFTIKKYDKKNVLESYVLNTYDNLDRLIKETKYAGDDHIISTTTHKYEGYLQVKSDVYSGETHMREITRTYDSSDNLVILQSKELQGFSSSMSYFLKYEYTE